MGLVVTGVSAARIGAVGGDLRYTRDPALCQHANRLAKAERDATARSLRLMRRERPEMARLVWRRIRNTRRMVVDAYVRGLMEVGLP